MAGASWATAIRLARRNARRSLGRSTLIAVLIGLPMMGGAGAAVVAATNDPVPEVGVSQRLGTADAMVHATEYDRLIKTEQPYGVVLSPPENAQPTRSASSVDVTKLLPAGSLLAPLPEFFGTVQIRVGDTTASYRTLLAGPSSLLEGTYRADEGRLPETGTEVAVTPSLAQQLDLLDGDTLKPDATVTDPAGNRYSVVGQVRPVSAPTEPQLWISPHSRLAGPSTVGQTPTYLAKFPAGVDVVRLQDQLAAKGINLMTRDDMKSYGQPWDYMDLSGVGLGAGFGLLQIALLAGTAFAVGARRQTRELGLVLANGGSPKDVRRLVLAQGLIIGLIGSVAGAALGVGIALSLRPVWENLTGNLITAWRIPWTAIACMIGVGVLTGLAAAAVPAIQAGRQPALAALAGRYEVSTRHAPLRRRALALLIAGLVANLTGTALLARVLAKVVTTPISPEHYNPTHKPVLPLVLILGGTAAVLIGLIWMLPNLVALAASAGGRLPLAGRLALRDAARQRHRTGPTAAAIMMAVAATAALAIFFANDFAGQAATYRPMSQQGNAVLSYQGDQYTPDGAAWVEHTLNHSAEIKNEVAKALPARSSADIAELALPGAPDSTGFVELHSQPGLATDQRALRAVDPGLFDRKHPAIAEALRQGNLVVPKAGFIRDGKAIVGSWDGGDKKRVARILPAQALPLDGMILPLRDHALVSIETARTFASLNVVQTHFELTRQPSEAELKTVAMLTKSKTSLYVERGYQPPNQLVLAGVLGAATLVTLMGVAVAVSLSAAEGRADLATLAAIGAQPRRRRNLAAAQAWLLGQIGCLLGVGVGALMGYSSRTITSSPYFAVPWLQLGAIVVAVPLFAGAMAWLTTRSRLPMVRRAE
ncbi:FtsX-like permease family protein [Kribbella deserti]|uniref:FtsX-like permease family protein n=1 Tax=Kribbella deserti TaxID=1926257 RepID=A0ABV6QUA8_9ACTN